MTSKVKLDKISLVLNRPRYPENIGAAVRAMLNMDMGDLLVVKPRNYDLSKIRKMATHEGADAVEKIRIFENLNQALGEFNFVVGATARLGKQRNEFLLPREMAEKLIPISQNNKIAILFGPEDRGLTNEDLRACHNLVNIPTGEFSSLNLSQAVMILSYEIFLASTRSEVKFSPRLAGRFELDNMYDHLKDILIRISFLNPENPEYWLNNIRSFFNRSGLRAKDVSIIRGICRQIDWYGKKCFQDGSKNNKKHLD